MIAAPPPTAFDASRSGVYATPAAVDRLLQAAGRAGVMSFDIALAEAREKASFLAAFAEALKFPASFGGNWDAFADSLQDLSWQGARGYIVRMRDAQTFARTAPSDYGCALEILRQSAEYWKARATPFVVLVDGAAELPAFAP